MRDKINERINSYRVVLILPNGENKGEMLKAAALDLAKRDGLDLVEVSRKDGLAVCKIMDYGKVLYEKNKKSKKTHAPVNKAMEISYNIGEHDLEIKKRKINEFLADGHKVQLSMKLKGREKYVGKGQTAREKFIAIVKEFFPSLKPSDIQENPRGFSYLLYPSAS